MSPPFPFVADPVSTRNAPLDPEMDVPDANIMYPEVPLVPAFIVLMVMLPLEVEDPYPADRDITPPVSESSVRPDDMVTSPPVYLSPVPMLRWMSPPFPFVEDPVATTILPDVPELVVPEVKLKWPLTPLVPALSVRTTTEPLDVAVPSPVVRDTAPPVKL
jgi:hypothetical protein